MSREVMEYYNNLDFEETEIEDELPALSCEISAHGDYVLLTDEDGAMPATLKQPVLLAYYTAEGAFQWSVGFKNSYVFNDIWSGPKTPAQKIEALLKYRASK